MSDRTRNRQRARLAGRRRHGPEEFAAGHYKTPDERKAAAAAWRGFAIYSKDAKPVTRRGLTKPKDRTEFAW